MTKKSTNPKDQVADGKIPLWLLSPIAKAKWALAMFSGLIKYGAWNWRRAGVRSSVYLSAAQRHLDAYLSGEEVDPVDGTDHRANVMACMSILMDAEAAGKLTDDRPPSVGVRRTYSELEALMRRLREQYKNVNPRHYTIADSDEEYCGVCDHDWCMCPDEGVDEPIPYNATDADGEFETFLEVWRNKASGAV